tara:strand:+ start:139 stop:390 length:252 start_codon:yes stop_codon:yes gene_type:complete
MKNTIEQEIIEQAHKNILFKRHLFIFILVNCLLTVLDFLDNGKLDWFYFASLGWGVGLLFHYLMIKPNSLFSVEKEIERLKKK